MEAKDNEKRISEIDRKEQKCSERVKTRKCGV